MDVSVSWTSRLSLSGSLALLFSSRSFPMDAGRIVLVLHTLPGSNESSHTSACFCFPGATASSPSSSFCQRGNLFNVQGSSSVDWQHLTSFSLEEENWGTGKPDVRWDAWENTTYNSARNESSSMCGLLQLCVTRRVVLWVLFPFCHALAEEVV